MTKPDSALLDRFNKIVGAQNALTDAYDMERYLTEGRGIFTGSTPVVLRPRSTEEVSQIMCSAFEAGVAVVPQGGGTGLVGGQIPSPDGNEIVISLERMRAVRNVSPISNTMTLEAGVTLSKAQDVADDADRLFPLSLGSEGTCQIGGNISTNAGGTAVLAYGNARDLVLGLEVVLADGRVWNGLRTLRKDNTGYDLKHLFIGGEGTLGIITAASLKLFAKPRSKVTAFIGVPGPAQAVALLNRVQTASGGRVTGFEILPRISIEFILKHGIGVKDPLSEPAPWYVLAELSSGVDDGELAECMETALGAGFEADEILDATIAASDAQSAMFWKIRELASVTQKPEGGSIKHDISVPVADIPAFIEEASAAATAFVPGARVVAFGHVGDGNLHFNISQPVGADTDEFLAKWSEMNGLVHGIVASYSGSFSAEHGIGQLKRDLLAQAGDPVGLELMRALKTTLDPKNILNPGKILKIET